MKKCDVNGPKEIPLYTYLKKSCEPPKTAEFNPRESFWKPIKAYDVEWNFEKFLVTPSGKPLFRFRSMVEPFDLIPLMNRLLELKETSLQNIGLNLLENIDNIVDNRKE